MSARILVVDDMPANVKLFEAKLSREYYDVTTAFSGAEALGKISQDPPDLILLDVMMPDMDGFEVCRRIRANNAWAHIPIIMVTALTDTASRVTGLEAGADDFLSKPINDLALFARVRSLLRLKMIMDEWRGRERSAGRLISSEALPDLSGDTNWNPRILIVEDSRIDFDRAKTSLGAGARVTGRATGAEGLALASEEDFDLIIISLTLIEEDGLRLCSQLRSNEKTRHVPILMMADDSEITRVSRGLELGANDYILKPIEPAELMARARTQVRRKRWQDRLWQRYEESLSMALIDPLTGIFNRRHFDIQMPQLTMRCREGGKPLTCIILDIDKFKSVNDTWGHPVGDVVLKEVATRAGRVLGNRDLLIRLGGEEFVIVSPECDLAGSYLLAEKVRHAIGSDPVEVATGTGQLDVTVSLGVAELAPGETSSDLLRRADDALYRAKREGRNRTIADGISDADLSHVLRAGGRSCAA